MNRGLYRPIQRGLCFPALDVAEGEIRMTAHLSSCRLLLAAAASALALAMPGAAAELNPAALAYKLPDQIKWNPPSAAGSQNSVLVGDPSKPGLYVVLNKWLKATISAGRTSIRTTASSPSSTGRGGWAAERHSIPITAFRYRPALSSPISANRCIGMGPRPRMPRC